MGANSYLTYSDQRRDPRTELPSSVAVHDQVAEQTVGKLGNLSLHGLMLISEQPIEEDLVMQLSFAVPGESSGRPIEVGARSLWCSPANVAGRYWTGFEIVDISEEDANLLQSVTR